MQDLREVFQDYHDPAEPPMGLQAADVLAVAKRSRRWRVAAGGSGLIALTLALALPLATVLIGHSRQERAPAVAPEYNAAIAAARAAGDTPSVMTNVVARWNPSLTPNEIYPSDWTRVTALPSNEMPNATEWHGSWNLADGQVLWVSLMYQAPGSEPQPCEPPCTSTPHSAGGVLRTAEYESDGYHLRNVFHERGSGYLVLVRVKSPVTSFAYTSEQLTTLATDPDLAFAFPAVTPTASPLS